MRRVNEAIKVWNKFSQMEEIRNGKNLILGREGTDVVKADNVTNSKLSNIHFPDSSPIKIKDEEFDNVFLILFSGEKEYFTSEYFDKVFSKIKPNGIIIIYIPHKFYYRGLDIIRLTPHDLMLELKNVKENRFELKDIVTCKYDGEFIEENMEKIEYSFYTILHKKSNLFRKNVEFSVDDGQVESLDD